MADEERNLEIEDKREKIWEQSHPQEVDVKSTAMVKSARKLPVYQFSRLDRNTDLHRPPDNWLRSDAQLSKTWVTGECTQFSSFEMAETLPDTVGEVDVISAAENIKKLLKIPFSKAQVSMAVHCVGKTLLLDELDLFKHLRSASEHEREWMKTFLIEAVLSKGKSLNTKRKTNELLQNWNLLSKFLYYSIGNCSEESEPQQTLDFEEQHLPPNQSALIQIPDLLPKTKPSEFARQALWQFEDIRMLIGTDLPIFGEGIHPAVSLRLKDMNSPINVLTGLDYWLDNLMSNVPELAMCYHLNGIVQKYELLKTEEIPNLEDASFAPQVVKDVAQNILSFLKSHCTKEGHTYWLFKGQDEDVVKLYDLTSLCNEYPNRPWENPFISPVAMLLYRVARNLSMSGPNKKDKSTIYKLLKNCLQLLEGREERHPEVVASASHLLSHVFLSEDDLTDPPPHPSSSSSSSPSSQKSSKKPPKPDSSSSGEDDDKFVIEEEEREASLSVPAVNTQNLMLPSDKCGGAFKERRQRRCVKTIYASKEEKARVALLYVVRGLKSIMECSESAENANKEQTTKLPSPLSSPTRVRPLCYTNPPQIGDGKNLTGCNPEELPKVKEGAVQDQPWTEEISSELTKERPGLVDLTQSCNEHVPLSRNARNISETCDHALHISQSHDVHDAIFTGIEQRSSSSSSDSDFCTSNSQVMVSRSSDVIPVTALPDAEESSLEFVKIQAAFGSAPAKLPSSKCDESTSSEQTSALSTLTQDQSDRADDSSSIPIERLSLIPATDSDVSFLPTESSVPTGIWCPGSWQHELNFLLFKKACQSYLVLSKAALDAGRYGQALHLADMFLLCQSVCQSVKLPEDNSSPNLLSDQLTVCGDCLVLLSHNLTTYVRQREDFQFTTAEDRLILGAVRQQNCTNEHEWAVDFRNNMEHNLRTGILCYTLALSEGTGHADDYLIALTRKQGNARNELGVHYMNQALAVKNEKGGLQKMKDLWLKSLGCLESGIEIFEGVDDVANIALLLCNIGKLMRLCAFSFGEADQSSGSQMTQQERYYYNKATDYYQRALGRLGQRKRNPALWESVTWELSSTYFAMATILQDNPPLSYMAQEQVEKDIAELMNKALNLCEADDISPAKQPVYQYRAATIHHRLASMHHNGYRNLSSQQKQKQTRSLSELHYQKAVRLFQELDRPSELLRVLLEKVALLEHQFVGQSGVSARIKTLHSALENLLQCKDALSTLHKTRTKDASESSSPTRSGQSADHAADEILNTPDIPEAGDFSSGSNDTSESKDKELTMQASPEISVCVSGAGNQGKDQLSVQGCYGDGLQQQDHKTEENVPSGIRRAATGSEAASESPDHPVAVEIPTTPRSEAITPTGIGRAPEQTSAARSPGVQTTARCKSSERRNTVKGQGSKVEGQGSRNKDRLTRDEEDERQRLESMWESRLQFVLLNLVKLHSANKKGLQYVSVYKKMYAASLGRTLPSASPSTPRRQSPNSPTLTGILKEVVQLYQGIK